MTRIRALIVDDEPLAREGVRNLLQKDPQVEIDGECSDGVQAIETIRATKPDLVLLDIQMPEVGGFEVIEGVGVDEMPAVIFVTAYDKDALEAFQVHALDYVLKPIDPERFAHALTHASEMIAMRSSGEISLKLSALLQGLHRSPRYLERIMVKGTGRIYFLRTDEVDWIEADGDYVRLHVQGKSHMIRERISTLEEKLNPAQFGRIHRSTMVNLNRIREIQPLFSGEHVVTLHDGKKLALSRSYREKLLALLNRAG